MGWSSGNEIFDPVCVDIIFRVERGELAQPIALDILDTLIGTLQDQDWDTEDESLEKFQEKSYVVEAFKQNDITLDN